MHHNISSQGMMVDRALAHLGRLLAAAGIVLALSQPAAAVIAAGAPGGSGAAESVLAPSYQVFLPVVIDAASQPAGTPGCIPGQKITDPMYLSSQANMRQIHADQAWAACDQGSSAVTVAVVDEGVDLTHPDLVSNLLPGYNFVENNTTPQDDMGHGTHVAGIIAASLNGQGVVGVAPQVKILPVRVMSNGSGSTSTIAQGIRWAADRAQVINLSLGGPSDSSVLRDAINYAIQTKGRLVVAAAGNDGATTNQTEYPAAYPGVVAVAAVDGTGAHASFSNTGSYVSLSAPGVNILSTVLGGQYAVYSGTSMATPHVSGLAALIWSLYPNDSAAQVFTAMKNTAVDLGDKGYDPVYGYGLINAFPSGGFAVSGTASLPDALTAQSAAVEDRSAPFVPGRVLVKLEPGASLAAILGPSQPLTVSADPTGSGILTLQVAPGQEWAQVDALRASSQVVFAEPDYILQQVK